MHAIGNQVLARFPRKRVVYATSEKFTNEFITSIQQGKIDEFRSRYRRIDLLLIDDIQFIADKERTQEEFFHTFNAIHEDGKQIVLSSDRPPKLITTLEERLRSRFEWGLIADLTRARPRDAHRHPARQGGGADGPHRLGRARVHRAQGDQQHPRAGGRAQSDRRLRQHGRHADQRSSSPRPCCRTCSTTPSAGWSPRSASSRPCPTTTASSSTQLKGQKRDRAIVMPRQIAMYLMRAETDVSLLRIGQELGGRDHSTVLHACDKIDRETQENEELRRDLAAVRELIYSGLRPARVDGLMRSRVSCSRWTSGPFVWTCRRRMWKAQPACRFATVSPPTVPDRSSTLPRISTERFGNSERGIGRFSPHQHHDDDYGMRR